LPKLSTATAIVTAHGYIYSIPPYLALSEVERNLIETRDCWCLEKKCPSA
jgi:hypothetical protein